MKGCLTKVKAFNATIDIIHIDVRWYSYLIGTSSLLLRPALLCIPEVLLNTRKDFLGVLETRGCDTDILNPTALRRLIHRYCIGSSTRIDILDPCLCLRQAFRNSTSVVVEPTPTRTIILNIVKMNVIADQ